MTVTAAPLRAGMVAIIGRPNAGKSTLLNQVLGATLSIVSNKAQTTRDQVRGFLNDRTRGQIVFVDTPGLHQAKAGGINQYMMQEARSALDAPDVIWYLVDPESTPKHEALVLEELAAARGGSVFLLFTKQDALKRQPRREASRAALEAALVPALESIGRKAEWVRTISAKNGEGIASLLEETWARLPEQPPFYPESFEEDLLSDKPTRFVVAELIREQLFRNLGDELPYSCAVEIESFKEQKDLTLIEALLHVDRESQKGMVIGKGGLKIKEIGIGARAAIEKLIGSKVRLELRVKTSKDWSRSPEKMALFGYKLTSPRRSSHEKRSP